MGAAEWAGRERPCPALPKVPTLPIPSREGTDSPPAAPANSSVHSPAREAFFPRLPPLCSLPQSHVIYTHSFNFVGDSQLRRRPQLDHSSELRSVYPALYWYLLDVSQVPKA